MHRTGLILIIAAVLVWPWSVGAEHLRTEAEYQEEWCGMKGGEAEYILPDRTRCDCLTTAHAVEMDFARKWAEALGQSLHYAANTGRRAGIVLIIEEPGEVKYLERLEAVIGHYGLPVDAWGFGPGI
jgi:hypothetical protein